MANQFEPLDGSRTHCRNCGAARVAHTYGTNECPTAYRPDTLAAASRELMAARASGDEARVFAARGEVQRLGGDADQLDPQP